MVKMPEEDREELQVRDEASRGNMDWLPETERIGSMIDFDHTWDGLS
jgi:hypothetical protein